MENISFELENKYRKLTELRMASWYQSTLQIIFIPFFILALIFGFFLGAIFLLIFAFIVSLLGSMFAGFAIIETLLLSGPIPGLILFGVMLIPFYGLFKLIKKIDPIVSLKKNIHTLFSLFIESKQGNSTSIKEIEEKVKKVYRTSNILITFSKFKYFFTEGSRKKIKILLDISSQVTLGILRELSVDLSGQMNSVHKNLEAAKRELQEEGMKTDGLGNVAEFQQIRLDKQIEQFEELQRVLVKI